MNMKVIKRDGEIMEFDKNRISIAITKAIKASHTESEFKNINFDILDEIVNKVYFDCVFWVQEHNEIKGISVERIQDFVERELIKYGYADTAKEYILYRNKRNEIRNSKDSITKCVKEIICKDSMESDLKRDNGNINGDCAMGTMLQIGSSTSKEYYINNMISKDIKEAVLNNYIHIHDLDFYALTVTCCQIDCNKLFKGGFNTGHGFLREPNSILTYGTQAAIAIQSDQNDCHGGQSIPNFDHAMVPGVYKSLRKHIMDNIEKLEEIGILSTGLNIVHEKLKNMKSDVDNPEWIKYFETILKNANYNPFNRDENDKLILNNNYHDDEELLGKIVNISIEDVDHDTHQSMEGVIANLNTLHSRAGAQVPFSSINLGCDTSLAGRMVTYNLLKALEEGLGNGETSIFPIVIFMVKEGFNYNPEDINHDLLKYSYKVTAKRLFPNYVFEDSTFNKQYYKEGDLSTLVATMGCRTRVIGNNYDKSRQQSNSRGNLSFTTINLPKLAIESKGDEKKFYSLLDKYMDITKKQLLERFEIQGKRKVKNMPFLMGQGVWIDSDKLKPNDTVREVLKHGSLSIGFVGLSECMVALYGHHHGEGQEYEDKAIAIIKHMREVTDRYADETGLNFSLFATPAESTAGSMLRKDVKTYGIIPGVTDKEYYTNSFHINVGFNIPAYKKIELEAPFHELTNAGHITYVELDGDTSKNVNAIEKIVKCMHDNNIGYGSINHPVDRDPVCGFTGVIDDECPNCHRRETEDEPNFERIRRITGYLVGTVDSWNDAKKCELRDRVKHDKYLKNNK